MCSSWSERRAQYRTSIACVILVAIVGHWCRASRLAWLDAVVHLLDLTLLCVPLLEVAVQYLLVWGLNNWVVVCPHSICLCQPHMLRYLEVKVQLLCTSVLV